MPGQTLRHGERQACRPRLLLGAVVLLVCPTAFAQAPAAGQPKTQLHGTVVDQHDRPVAGATVSGVVVATFSGGWSTGSLPEKTTDDQGSFTYPLAATGREVIVILRVRHKDAGTAKPVEVRGEGLGKPVTLQVSPENARSVRAHILDEEGQPVAGAAVSVKHRPNLPKPYGPGSPVPVAAAGGTTDDRGRFNSPRCLDPDGAYLLEAKAEGFLAAATPWKDMAGTEALAFGDLVLPRLRALEGQTLDRQGKPVAEARVVHANGRHSATATTDADGRFKLDAAFVAPSFLFVEKSGFRFHGRRCDRPGPVKVVLTRRDEPADGTMTALPPALTRAERRELAGRLLEPYLARVLEKGDDSARLRPLEILAKLDPGRMLQELEKRPYKEAWYDSYLRRAAAKALLADSFDEARSVVDSMKDPGFRCTGYLDLCDALPDRKRAEKLALLDQALLHSQGVQENDHRVLHLAGVAKRLWTLGEKERATKLLREGQAIARELPTAAWAGYARGAFAEDLALIDVPGARALMKDLKDPLEYSRHHGNLAHKLAGRDPAEAERVFDLLLQTRDAQQVFRRGLYAMRVCYRMAPADLTRTRKIAETVNENPYFKAQAYAVMAQALAKRDPKEALGLLDHAFDLLAELVASGKDQFTNFYDASSLAGMFLPVAEQIDPALVPEFFWRALALRRAVPSGAEDAWGRQAAIIGALALVTARYDQTLALELAEEAGRQRLAGALMSGQNTYLKAVAVADPRRAVALVEALPDGDAKDYDRQAVAGVLLADGDALWRLVHSALGVWYVDDEDL